MQYFYLILAFVLNSAANILFKLNATNGVELAGKSIFFIVRHNYLFILGILFFGINAIFYFLALRNIPLSTAYPIMVVMSLLIISVTSYFIIGEKINLMQLIGYIMIITGVTLIFYFTKKS
jgi:multidrug transporter EmrE-like cation transporter